MTFRSTGGVQVGLKLKRKLFRGYGDLTHSKNVITVKHVSVGEVGSALLC